MIPIEEMEVQTGHAEIILSHYCRMFHLLDHHDLHVLSQSLFFSPRITFSWLLFVGRQGLSLSPEYTSVCLFQFDLLYLLLRRYDSRGAILPSEQLLKLLQQNIKANSSARRIILRKTG